ncbi:MAG: glycosyltransferase family 4 protein [Blastocatellia bacterium]|nr:glycosyltransferase family 4 protein [Blastocatellia bacterium]
MITTFYPPYNFGGDGIFVQRLSRELAARGHSVEVIHCLDSYRALARNEPEIICEDEPNILVHGLESKAGVLSPLATQQTGFPLFKSAAIEEILSKKFDVIHYHNISLVGGPRLLEYGEAIKLYTTHEYWLVCPTHVLFKYNRAACTSRQCLRCSLIYRRPPQWWRYTRLLENAVRHIDAFIAPSRFSRDMHARMGLDLPMEHLPPFVPESEGGSSASFELPDREYFLFAGRLEKLKGLQTLLPVFKHYPKAALIVAGAGDYEAELKRMAEGCSNIRFLGRVSESHLQALYHGAVALIVPSLCYEVFPLVAVEAFKQETPAIVRRLGSLPEIIEESGGGIVFDTEEGLIEAMDRLLADRIYREELGKRGREAYLEKWTPQVHIERYLQLIHSQIAVRGQGSGVRDQSSS